LKPINQSFKVIKNSSNVAISKKKRLSLNQPTKFDIQWEQRFYELLIFKERFKHCNVPQQWKENVSLGKWVIRQRVFQRTLCPIRKQRLIDIGFVWNIKELRWWNKFEELKAYHKLFGHCNVSQSDSGYKSLSEWVGNQRGYYKKRKKILSEDKVQKLNELGFNWQLEERVEWGVRYQELIDFKNTHRHSNVPGRYKENTPLAAWVSQQRKKFKLKQLDDEQIQLLKAVEFEWQRKDREPLKRTSKYKSFS
jgi:Helicase associated domain